MHVSLSLFLFPILKLFPNYIHVNCINHHRAQNYWTERDELRIPA